MQLVTVSPGFRFVTLYSAEPASLSVRYTVPASKLLPLFEVLLLNAERVPAPTMAPRTPTIRRLRPIRLAFPSFRFAMSPAPSGPRGPVLGRPCALSRGHGAPRRSAPGS